MKRTFPFLLVIASGVALAGGDGQDKLNQLEAVLNGVRQEQQAVYQNYQMTKELRLMEVQEGTPPRSRYPRGTGINTPPPNYEDVVRAQMERELRIQQYTEDLKRLSVRYLELEGQRKALIEQVGELRQE